MTTLHADTGGSVSIDADGHSAEREFIVDDVSGDAAQRLYNALVSGGIPQYGESHPNLPGAQVTSISASPIENSAGQVKITVQYGAPTPEEQAPEETPESAILTISAGTTETTTQKNKDGEALIASITFSDGTTEDRQLVEATVLIPSLTLQFQRKERNNPIWQAIGCTGAVNSQSIGVFAAGTLLCTEIEGTTDDGGRSYNVSYVFQHNPASWKAVLTYVDKDTDKTHADVNLSTGNGVLIADVYPEADFSRLNLDFSFAQWANRF